MLSVPKKSPGAHPAICPGLATEVGHVFDKNTVCGLLTVLAVLKHCSALLDPVNQATPSCGLEAMGPEGSWTVTVIISAALNSS